MTKEITKAIVLQEIQDKFKLRELDLAKFLFDETVVPIYNIAQHFEEWWHKYTTKSITGTGAALLFSVPQDERWILKRYDVVFMTGAFTAAGIYIVRKNHEGLYASVYLDLKAAQNVSYHIETDVVLVHGDEIYVNIDGYTSTGNLRLLIDYAMEKIK